MVAARSSPRPEALLTA